MGLETLLEAAKYLEYQCELETGKTSLFTVAKGISDLSTNGTLSGAIPTPLQNGYLGQRNNGTIGINLHYNNGQTHQFKVQAPLSSSLNSATSLQRVPEPINGFKDHAYRRINNSSHSPDLEYYTGTNRMSKSVSPSNISGISRTSGTREVHNKLEKNRRAHLKECFEFLKSQLPAFEDRKISNLAILRSAIRHIQNLKRKEREQEHELERLARQKITLQQRFSILKKESGGNWDHLEWQTSVHDGVDLEIDRIDLRRSPTSTETTLSPDRMLLENHRSSESSDTSSPASNHVSRHDIEYEDSQSECDSQHPLSLTVTNCHITEQKLAPKKFYGQLNGVSLNGMSENGPISLVTTAKLSSSPLAAITMDKISDSPLGGANYINSLANNSGKKNGFSLVSSASLLNTKINIGQYYDEDKKVCK